MLPLWMINQENCFSYLSSEIKFCSFKKDSFRRCHQLGPWRLTQIFFCVFGWLEMQSCRNIQGNIRSELGVDAGTPNGDYCVAIWWYKYRENWMRCILLNLFSVSLPYGMSNVLYGILQFVHIWLQISIVKTFLWGEEDFGLSCDVPLLYIYIYIYKFMILTFFEIF